MRQYLFLLIVFLISRECLSQDTFNRGYFIDETGQKVDCLIKSLDWNNNPTEFSYTFSTDEETRTATIETVKEFGVLDVSKYIRASVKMDRSSSVLDKLSIHKNPEFKEEELFLKVLVEGKANLYQYAEGNLKRYFFSSDSTAIRQLVYKMYRVDGTQIAKNNYFRQQLYTKLQCEQLTRQRFEQIDYNKRDLIKLFIAYSKCQNSEGVYVEPKPKRDLFNLSLRPRLNSSSLQVRHVEFQSKDVIDFGRRTGVGLGLEFELILPINKDKWAFVVEPTLQSFQGEKTIDDVSVILNGRLSSEIYYTSIEIPFSVRYYFLLNSRSKLFVDASLVFDAAMGSTFEYNTFFTDGSIALGITSTENLAFGMGYKFKNKYSLQMRYQSERDLLAVGKNGYANSNWYSSYSTFSIILGYSIF